MKNLLTSLTAVLLVIWYSLSVIGFDVHTCSGSGESYVTTVIGGTTFIRNITRQRVRAAIMAVTPARQPGLKERKMLTEPMARR